LHIAPHLGNGGCVHLVFGITIWALQAHSDYIRSIGPCLFHPLLSNDRSIRKAPQ
jgi:hypothetical protein